MRNEYMTGEMSIKALEKEATTKNDLGVDVVSRQAVLDLIADYDLSMGQVVRGIHALPSVTLQEPKTGRWIYIRNSEVNGLKIVECSECGKRTYGSGNYCPNCGAKMVEPQESEDKE